MQTTRLNQLVGTNVFIDVDGGSKVQICQVVIKLDDLVAIFEKSMTDNVCSIWWELGEFYGFERITEAAFDRAWKTAAWQIGLESQIIEMIILARLTSVELAERLDVADLPESEL
ncbi:MAG: hypothetical protein ACYDHP_13340 [Ferrimicrobium sp.]